jgi:hypothetical protein
LGFIAVAAQQVNFVILGRKIPPAAGLRHLGAASPRDVMKVYGMSGIGDVDNRGTVGFAFSGKWIKGAALVVADVGDPSPGMFLDDGLIRAAAMEGMMSHQGHVLVLGVDLRVGEFERYP